MNLDSYGEIFNGGLTYKEIVKQLKNNGSCIIGWTDELATHYDIFFSLGTSKNGYIQRGIKANDLFVGIVGRTFYGFDTKNIKLGGYIQEKLDIHDKTGDKIAELINGVIEELNGGVYV